MDGETPDGHTRHSDTHERTRGDGETDGRGRTGADLRCLAFSSQLLMYGPKKLERVVLLGTDGGGPALPGTMKRYGF